MSSDSGSDEVDVSDEVDGSDEVDESDEVNESDMKGKTLNRWGTGLYGIQYDGNKKPSRLDV